jgi:hypothetical protein
MIMKLKRQRPGPKGAVEPVKKNIQNYRKPKGFYLFELSAEMYATVVG